MLRIHAQYGATAVRDYFTQALCKDDYYQNGTERPGVWRGIGAELLGLSGPVEREQFARLTDNLHPFNDERLTPRTKQGRRIGYDFTFSVPKSVSLVYAVTRDEDILWAFQKSVWDTMSEIEQHMATRVRRDGADFDRTTGNMVWSEYLHFTTRPIDGEPDPELHAHCFTANCTYDHEEQRWKAGQFGELKKMAPEFQVIAYSKLAANLVEVGYPLERTGFAFEIAGVPREWIEVFSRRTQHIESVASELGLEQEQKSSLGAKTRERKRDDRTLDELCERWTKRLGTDEVESIRGIKHGTAFAEFNSQKEDINVVPDREPGKSQPEEQPKRARPLNRWHPLVSLYANSAVKHAVRELFDRDAIITESRLLSRAMELSYGRAERQQIVDAIEKHSGLVRRRVSDTTYLTTKEAIEEECHIVRFAKQGRSSQKPLGRNPLSMSKLRLDERDRQVLDKLMQSTDRVTLFKYTGPSRKPELCRAAMTGIQQNLQELLVIAPNATSARRAEKNYGIERVQTLHGFLADDEYASVAKNIVGKPRRRVFWIEDAGRLGTRAFAEVVKRAERTGSRIVLAGDDSRSKRYERGSPFRLMREEANLKTVERRVMLDIEQKLERTVDALRHDVPIRAVDALVAEGTLVEAHEADRTLAAARMYFGEAVDAGRSVVFATPNWQLLDTLTNTAREVLREKGKLTGRDRSVLQLRPAGLSSTDMRKAEAYERGMVIDFHRPTRGFKSGQRTRVLGKVAGGVLVQGWTKTPVLLNLRHADRFMVSRAERSHLAVGDRIRVTKYTTPFVGKPIRSGTVLTVKAFNPVGHIVVDGGRILSRRFGHFQHEYAATTSQLHDRRADAVALVGYEGAWVGADCKDLVAAGEAARREFKVFTDDKETVVDVLDHVRPELNASHLEDDPEQVDLEFMEYEDRFDHQQPNRMGGFRYG